MPAETRKPGPNERCMVPSAAWGASRMPTREPRIAEDEEEYVGAADYGEKDAVGTLPRKQNSLCYSGSHKH